MPGVHKSAGGACKIALVAFAILSVGLPVVASVMGDSAQEPGAQPPTGRHIEQAQPLGPAGRHAEIEGILVGTAQAASDAHVNGQRVEPEASGQLSYLALCRWVPALGI